MDAIIEFFSAFFADPGTTHAIYVSLLLAFSATSISAILGINLGLLLEAHEFRGKSIIVRFVRTCMGLPPVVVGLAVYLLIMRRGPLGDFGLLFTIKGMVLAQCIIITPIITGLMYMSAQRLVPSIRFFAKCIGANAWQTQLLIYKELSKEIYFVIVTGFGRSLSEIGAVMLIGGNIKGATRTMTTAITLLKSQGIYTEGIMLGVTLLVFSFILQFIADFLRKERNEHDNY